MVTNPSAPSWRSASRTGMRLTENSAASASWSIRSPAGNFPLMMRVRTASATACWMVRWLSAISSLRRSGRDDRLQEPGRHAVEQRPERVAAVVEGDDAGGDGRLQLAGGQHLHRTCELRVRVGERALDALLADDHLEGGDLGVLVV